MHSSIAPSFSSGINELQGLRALAQLAEPEFALIYQEN